MDHKIPGQHRHIHRWLSICCIPVLLIAFSSPRAETDTQNNALPVLAPVAFNAPGFDPAESIESLGLTANQADEETSSLAQDNATESDEYPPLLTEEQKTRNIDFWRMMLDGFSVPALNTASVASLTRLYANNPQFLTRSMQRASPYIHEIIGMLKYRGMPTDLALLPVIESSYDPRALSPAAAAGIWQFIPETGRRYGLRQDWLRDERRDPMAATRAALDYLKFLHNMFGDWHLALAGYNCGENCVASAIAKSRASGGGRDFASIAHLLPQETRDYVPRFIAVRNVFRNLDVSGVRLPHIHQNPRITSITLNHPVDLASIANLAGMNFQELKTLNAGVMRQVIPPNSGVIWITENGLEKLNQTLAKSEDGIDEKLLINLRAAKASPGESLHAFASRHNITAQELRAINNIHSSLSTISSGTLFVPRRQDESPFPSEISKLSPLVMVGEQALNERIKRISTSQKQLTAHPVINADSGWIPGRLKVSGSKTKSRTKKF
jgi:membrane-bound lytic murein transglycosylase D